MDDFFHKFAAVSQNSASFQCEICEFSSKKKMQTKQHMKNEHNVDEYYPYKCQQCDFKQYELSHGFTRHVQGMSL